MGLLQFCALTLLFCPFCFPFVLIAESLTMYRLRCGEGWLSDICRTIVTEEKKGTESELLDALSSARSELPLGIGGRGAGAWPLRH